MSSSTIMYENSLELGPDIKLLPTINPKRLFFKNIDLSEGIPSEVFLCFMCETLVINYCNLSSLDPRIKNMKLVSLDLSNNNFVEFPKILSSMPTLNQVVLDDNYITSLPLILDKPKNISVANQTIEEYPHGDSRITDGYFLKANILDVLSNPGINIIGFNHDWMHNMGEKLSKCCTKIIQYTYRGDRLLNASLRSNKLYEETKNLYNTLLYSQSVCGNLPIGGVLFRGINKSIIENIMVGDMITDYGFSSFSLSKNIASDFSKHILVYKIEDNITGVPFSKKHGLSYYNEMEIAIGPNVKFQITGKITIDAITYYFVKRIPSDFIFYFPDSLSKRINFLKDIMSAYDGIIIKNKFHMSIPNDISGLYQLYNSKGVTMFTTNNDDHENNDEYEFFYHILLGLISESTITAVTGNIPLLLEYSKTHDDIIFINNSNTHSYIHSDLIMSALATEKYIAWTDNNDFHLITYSELFLP